MRAPPTKSYKRSLSHRALSSTPALRQVVPDSLAFCWTIVRDDENMADAELELEFVAAEVACRGCGQQSEIESRWSVACPRCQSADVAVVRGEEFLVTSVDVT